MLKSVLSLVAALSVVLGAPYSPPITEIDHIGPVISALETTDEAAESAVYTVFSDQSGYETYTCNVFGCRFTVPAGMTPDISNSALRFRLDRGGRSIDIYKESFSSEADCLAYISYSNRFIDDTETYSVEAEESLVINGLNAKILKWRRSALSPQDKNLYVCADYIDGTDVYTMMIRSNSTIDDYMDVVMSFSLTTPTAVPTARPFSPGPERAKNDETDAAFDRLFGENSKLSWGLFVPHNPIAGINEFLDQERSLDAKMDVCLFYFFVSEVYNPSMMRAGLDRAWENGKICELTLQTGPTAGPTMIYDILRGRYDSFFADFAADLKDFGHPVLIRLFNEMNGDWCSYSGYHTSRDPEVYVQLYRYIYNKLEAEGAGNLIWVWNPNEKSFPNFSWNDQTFYYPGGEYVDVVGLTGYNTGTYYENEKWRSFDSIYRKIYRHAELMYRKPLMITEFACSSTGGDKVGWVKDMFAVLPEYPKIKVAVWWSGCDYDPANGNISRSYFINDTEGVMEVFKENLSEK